MRPVLSSGNADRIGFKPVLQVADIRLVDTQNQDGERYRVGNLLSDGKFTQQGMLASQYNELVKSEKLRKGSIVQLIQFLCKTIQNRMIIIIVDLNVIVERCDPLGVPKQYPVTTEGNAIAQDQPMNSPSHSAAGSSISISSSGAYSPLFNLSLTVFNSPIPSPPLSLKLSISPAQATNKISQTQNLHCSIMASIPLTEGAIAILSSSDANETVLKPVLQVADIRLAQSTERYRILLSDGKFIQQGILATQLNDLVKSEKLQKGSVVQLTCFSSNVIQNRRIIVIVDINVIAGRCDPIGRPKQYLGR